MLEERRADDIRIGHLDHFLDVQFGKAMEHFLPMYLDFARFSAITDGKNALLSLLSNFAAYLVIGARALYGVLPIGDVLLYAGSVTRAMSDLQTFLATGSEFDYINSYLSTYEDFIAQPSMSTTVHCRLRNATTASTNLHSTMSHSLIPVRIFRYSNM